MQTRTKQITLTNGIHDAFPLATNTVLRLSAGNCEVRAVWKDNAGDTHGKWESLAVDDPLRINERIDAIEVRNATIGSGAGGAGTLVMEGYST